MNPEKPWLKAKYLFNCHDSEPKITKSFSLASHIRKDDRCVTKKSVIPVCFYNEIAKTGFNITLVYFFILA